jgi:MFS family permease
MTTNMDLRRIEHKAWTSFFQDGLLDMVLGLLLAMTGVAALPRDRVLSGSWQVGIYLALLVLCFAVFWLGKKHVTVRRLGRVRFGPSLRGKSRKSRAITALLVTVQVAVVVAGLNMMSTDAVQSVPGGRALWALVYGVWMMGVFSLASYWIDFTRGYVIGVLYALGFSGTMLLDSPMMFVVAGAVILLMGLVVFVRFLREYPVPEENTLLERTLNGTQ